MYDYLAKIILLGPSGTGKYVYPPPLGLTQAPLADLSLSPRTLPHAAAGRFASHAGCPTRGYTITHSGRSYPEPDD